MESPAVRSSKGISNNLTSKVGVLHKSSVVFVPRRQHDSDVSRNECCPVQADASIEKTHFVLCALTPMKLPGHREHWTKDMSNFLGHMQAKHLVVSRLKCYDGCMTAAYHRNAARGKSLRRG